MASSQARMRPVSLMFTQSETAPMVQKLVLLATAPMTAAMPNTSMRICVWIVNSMIEAP